MATHMTALITGASVGIGYELAKVFAENGYDLVLVSRDRAKLEQVAAECRSLAKIHARVLAKDLSAPEAPREIFDELMRDGVVVDVLVNNAGFGTYGRFADIELDADVRLLQVNIVALTALTKLFLREMVARRNGRILNVASTAAFQAGPLMATYYASKAYVLHFTEAVAQEVGGQGVTVSALCPGPTQTEFQKRARIEGSRIFKGRASMDARTVALAGFQGLMAGKRVVVPGFTNKFTSTTARLAPRRLATFLAGKLNEVH
jgi:uncharacterized protein